MGYALWLIPSKPDREALSYFMASRPSWFQPKLFSDRSFPAFVPHVTIVTFKEPLPPYLNTLLPTGIDEPVRVTFEGLEVGDKFLSSVSVGLVKSPKLMTIRESIAGHIRADFNVRVGGGRFPHISLFYLDEVYKGDRERFATELIMSRRVVHPSGTRPGQGLLLNCHLNGAPKQYEAMSGFSGSEIWLVDCNGPPVDWKVIEKRDLGAGLKGTQRAYQPSKPARVADGQPPLDRLVVLSPPKRLHKGKERHEGSPPPSAPPPPKPTKKEPSPAPNSRPTASTSTNPAGAARAPPLTLSRSGQRAEPPTRSRSLPPQPHRTYGTHGEDHHHTRTTNTRQTRGGEPGYDLGFMGKAVVLVLIPVVVALVQQVWDLYDF